MKYQQEFTDYLTNTKRMAKTSQGAYISDAVEFVKFIEHRGQTPEEVSNADVSAFLTDLKDLGKSGATVNRKLASVRCYFNCLQELGKVDANPTTGLKSPRIERQEIEFLTYEEVVMLLEAPGDDQKGMRDRALLELMYATGVRSGEVVGIKVSDLNLRIGFISCMQDNGKTRMIPVGRPAREALTKYLNEVRPAMVELAAEDKNTLFVNYLGEPLTRQGVWKIIKHYGEKVGIGDKISPQILRNSFAAHMVQNGADLKSLQEPMGYEDIMATKIFMSLTKNRIIDVYDRTHPRA